MKPILYEVETTSFTTNGLGRLSDAAYCHVTEERNGQYELEMQYPVDGMHYKDIKEHRIIYAPHDDTKVCQPFEIYKITTPMNGLITVYAHHISYKLSKITVMPFEAQTINEAFADFVTFSANANPFTFSTDKTTRADFSVAVPSTIRSLLGGSEGSILDVYGGGEYEWDNFTVHLRSSRGSDSGVTIRYGKNLTDLEKETDSESVWTGVAPFWEKDDVIVTLTEKVIYSSAAAAAMPYQMVVPLDLSSNWDEAPTEAQLRAAATIYVNANAKSEIPSSIKISFTQLWQTEEYANVAPLQRLKLCDTVSVYHGKIGISVKAKIVEAEYDVILERYTSMTIGEPKTSFSSAIKKDVSETQNTLKKAIQTATTEMEKAIQHGTDMITGGLGGYVVLKLNANDQPEEILIMDTADITTAVNVIRLNANGIGYSTTGYNGTYTTAWTIDGKFYADRIDVRNLSAALITTGTMLADRILGGTLKLGGSNNTNGQLQVYDASGNIIGRWDNDGIHIFSGEIQGPTIKVGGANNSNGIFQVLDASGNVISYFDKDGANITGDITLKGGGSDSRYGYITHKITERQFFVEYTVEGLVLRTLPGLFTEWTQGSYGYASHGITRWSQGMYQSMATSLSYASIILATNAYSGASYDRNNARVGIFAWDGTNIHLKAYNTTESTIGFDFPFGINARPQYQSSSSRRFKHDIKVLEAKELDPHNLLDLRTVQFIYNDDIEHLQYKDMKGQLIPGFIAEEVNEVYPAAVIHDEEGRIHSWDERRIIPGMLTLIQEQQKRIDELEAKVQDLYNKIEGLLTAVK